MSTVGLYYHPKFLEHDQPGHPENAERLTAVMDLLGARRSELPQLVDMPFQAAEKAVLARVHAPQYVSDLERVCAFGGGMLDGDTYVTDASFDAASLAVGACATASRDVLQGNLKRAMVLPRPPGHHAYADHPEGFCLFNNIAFAARTALDDFGLQRVAIIDWDVHHGNGTEAIFYDDPRVLYTSTHQWGIYPGTGAFDAVGRGPGHGATLNVPLPAGVGDAGFSRVFDELICPSIRRFKPQLLLVSCGYDAHWRDPLANLKLSLAGYAKLTRDAISLADELCGGNLVIVLEGGYDLDVLAHGVFNTLHLLGGGDDAGLHDPIGPHLGHERNVDAIVTRVKQTHTL